MKSYSDNIVTTEQSDTQIKLLEQKISHLYWRVGMALALCTANAALTAAMAYRVWQLTPH